MSFRKWFFGAKLHVGVDAGSGYIHTTIVTAANVHDGKVTHELIREDDQVVYGDSAYCAVGQHKEVQEDPHLSQVDYRTNRQKPYRKYAWDEGLGTHWLRKLEYQKSRVRSKVEYVFHVTKGIFGFRKPRYKGLAKLKKPPGRSLCQRLLLHAGGGEESRKNSVLYRVVTIRLFRKNGIADPEQLLRAGAGAMLKLHFVNQSIRSFTVY